MLVVDASLARASTSPPNAGFASLVKYVNQSPAKVVCIDMPSGLDVRRQPPNIDRISCTRLHISLAEKKLSMMMADCQALRGPTARARIRLSMIYCQYRVVVPQSSRRATCVLACATAATSPTRAPWGIALLIAAAMAWRRPVLAPRPAALRSRKGDGTHAQAQLRHHAGFRARL
jgi:NAD(P)H-hydrate epimerase